MKKILPIILIILFTISIVPKEFQNDTLFTLAIGEKIVNNEDVDSLTWHENVHFEHSGFFDLIIYKIYTSFGFFGIYTFVIAFATIQAIMFYNIVKYKTNNNCMAFIMAIIIVFLAHNEFTARAQVISFTLFLIEFYCIEKLLDTNKNIYFGVLVFIPLILANLHSSVFPMYFIFYLPYFAEFILKKLKFKEDEYSKIIIQERKIKKILILFIFGIIAGFCTPTGLCPFTDMFKGMSENAVSFINELHSINILNSIEYSFFVFITIAILCFTKTKIKVTDAFYILGFTLMGSYVSRCIYFFLWFATPCIARIIVDCLLLYNVKFSIKMHCKVVIIVVYTICVLLYSIENMFNKINKKYIPTETYPIYAVNYILNNIDISKMKIYNHFNFGSYLEFKGIPVFIDSRSGIYTPEFNKGVTIMEDYIQMLNGEKSYKEIFDRYEITHALLYNTELINQYIFYDRDWNLLYQDDNFSFYERKK